MCACTYVCACMSVCVCICVCMCVVSLCLAPSIVWRMLPASIPTYVHNEWFHVSSWTSSGEVGQCHQEVARLQVPGPAGPAVPRGWGPSTQRRDTWPHHGGHSQSHEDHPSLPYLDPEGQETEIHCSLCHHPKYIWCMQASYLCMYRYNMHVV